MKAVCRMEAIILGSSTHNVFRSGSLVLPMAAQSL